MLGGACNKNNGDKNRGGIGMTNSSAYCIPGLKVRPELRRSTFIQRVFNEVCEVMGVDPARAMKRDRKRELVQVRQLTFLICRRSGHGITLTQLGQFFGKDHTSIINGIRTMTGLVSVEPWLKEKRDEVERKLDKVM